MRNRVISDLLKLIALLAGGSIVAMIIDSLRNSETP